MKLKAPDFLKKIDKHLLLHKPLIWASRVHQVLFIVASLLLANLLLIEFISQDASYLINPKILLLLNLILATLIFLGWSYTQGMFNYRLNHGITSKGHEIKVTIASFGLVCLLVSLVVVPHARYMHNILDDIVYENLPNKYSEFLGSPSVSDHLIVNLDPSRDSLAYRSLATFDLSEALQTQTNIDSWYRYDGRTDSINLQKEFLNGDTVLVADFDPDMHSYVGDTNWVEFKSLIVHYNNQVISKIPTRNFGSILEYKTNIDFNTNDSVYKLEHYMYGHDDILISSEEILGYITRKELMLRLFDKRMWSEHQKKDNYRMITIGRDQMGYSEFYDEYVESHHSLRHDNDSEHVEKDHDFLSISDLNLFYSIEDVYSIAFFYHFSHNAQQTAWAFFLLGMALCYLVLVGMYVLKYFGVKSFFLGIIGPLFLLLIINLVIEMAVSWTLRNEAMFFTMLTLYVILPFIWLKYWARKLLVRVHLIQYIIYAYPVLLLLFTIMLNDMVDDNLWGNLSNTMSSEAKLVMFFSITCFPMAPFFTYQLYKLYAKPE